MAEYKEVMQWYSKNKQLIFDTFALNHQLGIESRFDINGHNFMVISPQGYPDVKEPGNNFSWRFRFLQHRIEKFLCNTVQS